MATLYHDIEPYRIQLHGLTLTVLPMNDGVYRVQQKEKTIADLYPEITAAGIYWNGFGQISPLFAEEIGAKINACEV